MELEKSYIEEELAKLIKIRGDFLNYLDNNIPKDKNDQFDFKNNPKLDAQDVYSHFFKLDYQARKLRGFLVKTYEINAS